MTRHSQALMPSRRSAPADIRRAAPSPARNFLQTWFRDPLSAAIERLFRFTASPTSATILEVRGWRSEFPELDMIERELERRRAEAGDQRPPATPFDLADPDRERRPARGFARGKKRG